MIWLCFIKIPEQQIFANLYQPSSNLNLIYIHIYVYLFTKWILDQIERTQPNVNEAKSDTKRLNAIQFLRIFLHDSLLMTFTNNGK